jgi:uncharacterized cupin superfamily protein
VEPRRALRQPLSDAREDGRKIGVSYEELPPGKQSCPLHYHMLEEEHIIALQGEATLRLGDERFRIKAGDYVGFPAGQRAGHCLINESDAPFVFIMIGDREPNEVCVYPDSGKGMVSAFDRAIFRAGETARLLGRRTRRRSHRREVDLCRSVDPRYCAEPRR